MRGLKKIAVASLLIGTALFSADNSYAITPYVGKNFTDSKLNMNDPTVIGLNFDTFFNEYVGLRIGYERLLDMERDGVTIPYLGLRSYTGDYSGSYTGQNNLGNANQGTCNFGMKDKLAMNRVSVNGIFKYDIAHTLLTPYVFAGIGNEFCEDGDCRSSWTRNLGLGMGVHVNCKLDISPEVKLINRDRDCGSESKNLTDITATLGATYKFGQPKVVERVITNRVEVPVERIVTKRVEVPVERVVIKEVPMCKIPKKYKDRCDNSYYIQIAGFKLCPTCKPILRDKNLLGKLRNSNYKYTTHAATIKGGKRVGKVLIGPYRCKRDAFRDLCNVQKYFKCDAFVYSKRR
jgi:hypothetical protein